MRKFGQSQQVCVINGAVRSSMSRWNWTVDDCVSAHSGLDDSVETSNHQRLLRSTLLLDMQVFVATNIAKKNLPE